MARCVGTSVSVREGGVGASGGLQGSNAGGAALFGGVDNAISRRQQTPYMWFWMMFCTPRHGKSGHPTRDTHPQAPALIQTIEDNALYGVVEGCVPGLGQEHARIIMLPFIDEQEAGEGGAVRTRVDSRMYPDTK
jgi:hypothetical protein